MTDKTIVITLNAEEMELAREVLNGFSLAQDGEDSRILAKIGPSTTLTHHEAEVLQVAIEHHGSVVGRDVPLAERIAAALSAQ